MERYIRENRYRPSLNFFSDFPIDYLCIRIRNYLSYNECRNHNIFVSTCHDLKKFWVCKVDLRTIVYVRTNLEKSLCICIFVLLSFLDRHYHLTISTDFCTLGINDLILQFKYC